MRLFTNFTPCRAVYHRALLALFSVLISCTGALAQASSFSQYDRQGPYAVQVISRTGPGSNFSVYKPRTLSSDETYPVITWGNGTGATPVTYNGLLEHLASWGYVVVASRNTNVGSGDEMVEGIDYILSENSRSGSEYYQRIDTDAIGATGHSQGGAGTINTAIQDSRVTGIAPLAPATFSAPFFYSTRNVQCPMFIMVGSNDNLASPSSVYRVSYSSATTTAIYGELRGEDHFSLTGDAGPFKKYITAWFEAVLKKDGDAEDLFFASGAPLFNDNSWSRVESSNLDDYTPGTGEPDGDGGDEEEEDPNDGPTGFFLSDNVPNPFSSQTTIAYGISESAYVRLTIYNAFGFPITSLVRGFQTAGQYEVTLSAQQLPRRGTYYYVLSAGDNRESKRLVLE